MLERMQLKTLSNMKYKEMDKKVTMLMILDGFGNNSNEKGNAVLRIDNMEQAVECTSAEQVIDIIKMTEILLGVEFFYFSEEVA